MHFGPEIYQTSTTWTVLISTESQTHNRGGGTWIKIDLIPLCDADRFNSQLVMFGPTAAPAVSGTHRHPAIGTQAFDAAWMELPMERFSVTPRNGGWHLPPDMAIRLEGRPPAKNGETLVVSVPPNSPTAPDNYKGRESAAPVPPPSSSDHPRTIKASEAVALAYAREIESVASFLKANLSVLVFCDKLVVQHLYGPMVRRSHHEAIVLTVPEDANGGGMMSRSLRQRQLAKLKKLITALGEGHVLVIPHLDLLAGGSDSNLPTESRELIELVYEQSAQASVGLRRPIAGHSRSALGAARGPFGIPGVQRTVVYPDGRESPLGCAW